MESIDYSFLCRQLEALTENVENQISNLANASALLFYSLPEVSWAGFYLLEDGQLILGPFQGKTACTLIRIGKGVCGTAVQENKTILVPNVHEFPGHIACDSASNSEIVIPIRKNGEIIGVLDLDSTLLNRFTEEDKNGLEKFVSILEKSLD